MQTTSRFHTWESWLRLCFSMALLLMALTRTTHADDYANARSRYTNILVGPAVTDSTLINNTIIPNCNSVIKSEGGATNLWSANPSSFPYSAADEATWVDPTTGLPSSTVMNAHITDAYTAIANMATAYGTNYNPADSSPVTPPACYQNATLGHNAIYALNWLNTHWYTKTGAADNGMVIANDIDTKAAIPSAIMRIMTLVYPLLITSDIITMEGVIDHNVGTTACCDSSGANLADVGIMRLLEGIISNTYSYTTIGTGILSGVIALGPNLEHLPKSAKIGFHEDGSYIQHASLPYTAGYGLDFVGDIFHAYYISLGPTPAANAAWASTLPANPLVSWALDGLMPLMNNGNMMSMVAGRYVGREASGQENNSGATAFGEMLAIASLASITGDIADSNTIESFLKYQVSVVTPAGSLRSTGNFGMVLYDAMMADAVPAAAAPNSHKTYYDMDRVTHLRPNYALGIAMSSTRIVSWEDESENPSGFHSGDGMTYLYTDDYSQFSSFNDSTRSHAFWPSVDGFMMPGTTTIKNSCDYEVHGNSNTYSIGGNDWVGGTTLGAYGSAGMSINPLLSDPAKCGAQNASLATIDTTDSLSGFKSWFMFDQEIVALGAGITSNQPVTTIIENRKLASSAPNAFYLNGYAQPTAIGTASLPFTNPVSSAWLQGNVSKTTSAGIGYYFPAAVTLYSERVQNPASWATYDPTVNGATASVAADYQLMYLDHGTPSNASYAYVLLPNFTEAQTDAYAAKPLVSILSNTSAIQAVQQTTLGMIGANFWSAGQVDLPGNPAFITSSAPASVMTSQNADGTIDIAVSDPTQLNTGIINLQLDLNGSKSVTVDPGITIDSYTPIQLSVNASGSTGKTFHAKITGTGSSISVVASTTQVTIANAGASGTATLKFSAIGGFSGTLSTTCSVVFVGAGANASLPACSLSPASATINSTTPVNMTLTVTTTATHTALAPSRPSRSAPVWAFTALLFIGWQGRRRISRKPLLAILLLAALGGLAGCGGGSKLAGGGGTPTVIPGTTSGTYQVTVTGTSSTSSASAAITFVVP